MAYATGPALRKLASHRSIHEGAHVEARDLTNITNQLLKENRIKEYYKAANALIEYWDTRIIAHADAEEKGLYLEILEENPELEIDIHMLTRDHDLLRIIIEQIKQELKKKNTVTEDIMNQFHTLLIVNEIHSRSEESKLLDE